ncbi:S-layer homology domain-containing protein [Paenibacillus sp. GCM10027628]|uniref:S-layer homology domain-containing protein n=1 Tax=Paenibacillus sp. GCM10027628 TaxID=3273413 RepID=UPI003644ADAB
MNWKKSLKLLLVGALTIGLWPAVLAPQTAKAAAVGPGGVTTNLHLWLRADAGVTTANGTVSEWKDQSGNNRDFSQTDATKQPVYNDGSNRINFNEAVTFDGTNDYLLNANGVLGSSAYNNFNVFLMSGIGIGSNSILWEETSGGGRLNVHLPYSGTVYWDAGSQATERVSALAGTVGPKYIWNFNYGINSSVDAGQSIYRDGNALVSAPSRTNPLTGINHKMSLGSQYDTNGNPVSYYNGQVGEIIFYSGPLTATDRLKINSYLAIKYGKSLNNLNYLDSNATPIWNADLNYNSNIAGIARDDAQGLYQKQSRSANDTSKLTIGIGAQLSMKNENISETLADKQSLIWGDNGQPLKFDKQIGSTDKNHAERIWKVQNTGNVGEVLIAIPKNMIPANSTLLVNGNDSDFTNATEHQLTVVSFEGIDYFTTKTALANGQFFTFAAPVPVPNSAVEAGGNKIILTFDKEVGWTNSTGFTITNDGTPTTPVINVDPTDAKKMIFTLPTGTDVTGKTVNVSYNGKGNLIGTNSVPVNQFSMDVKTGTLASAANNSVKESPSSVTVGGSVTLTAAGDRQSETGAVYGDERYIPTSWTSTESGKSGTFSVSGVTYTSTYTPATAGSYTVTATFTKQKWDGSAWTDTTTTDTKTSTVTAVLPVMGGSATISGTAKVGQTLTADLTGITYTPSTSGNIPTYQWYRDGVAIASATDPSYAVTADDVGSAITVTVTADGTHATGSVTSAATGAVVAADGAAAPTNVILDASAKTLSWNNVSGYANVSDYEYTVDGGKTWTIATANPQTMAIVPSSVANVQVRVKGDSSAGRAPGEAGTAALPSMGGSVAIRGIAKVGQTLTADLSGITYTPSTSGNVPTYQWYRNGIAITNTMGSSYTLTADDMGAAITVKVTADGTHATGNVTSSATGAVAAADGAAAPAAPAQASKTATSITLQAVAGQEYSKDGGATWQDSPTFSGLTPDTNYTFVTRVKATATQSASAISVGTTIRTSAPTSSNADLNGLTLSSGTLSPAFAAGTTDGYTASAANSVSSTTVTATVYDSAHATVTASVYNSAGTLVKGPISLTSGAASDSLPLSVGINTIKVVVRAQDGTTQTYTVTVTRASATEHSSGSPSTGSPSTGAVGTGDSTSDNSIGFRVIVNGKEYDQIAAGTTNKEDGKTVVTATVDKAKLAAQLAQEGDKPVIIVPVATVSADKVTAVLTGDAVKAMEKKQAMFEVQTTNGNYKLPASEIAIDRLASQLGGQVNLSDIVMHVDIAKSDDAKVKLAESTAGKGKFTVVVPPVEFTVTASYNGKTVDVDKFNAYVEREIPLPDGIDPNKITTATVLAADGTVYHVPTYITFRDGKYYAVVSSLTNSMYTLIWHPMTFADVAGHWSKDAVNDMASRLIVNGVDVTHYNPNAAITRAEFAAIIVRGLGLPENGKTSAYGDVKSGDWYVGAVAKAQEYGIINGYEDGTFRPSKTITREEAMAMIARAMKLAGLDTNVSGADATSALASFTDSAAVDAWAKQAVAATVKSGLVKGSDTGLKPASDITRAETAAIVQRMLIKANLIDNRNSK